MRKYERCHCLKGQVKQIWKVKMKVVPVLIGTLRPVTSKPGSSIFRLRLSLTPLLELDIHPRSLVEVLSSRKTINTAKLQLLPIIVEVHHIPPEQLLSIRAWTENAWRCPVVCVSADALGPLYGRIWLFEPHLSHFKLDWDLGS